MNELFIARSLMVAVCMSLSSKILSMAARDVGAICSGSSMRLMIQPI